MDNKKKQRTNEIKLASQIIDGLRDAAFQIARELGREEIVKEGGAKGERPMRNPT